VQQSNGYIIGFSVITTVVLGGLLALAAVALGPQQKEARDLFTKKQILKAVMEIKDGDDIASIYSKRIKSEVVDFQGNVVDGQIAEAVSLEREYKKPKEERMLPVFKYVNESDPAKVEAVIVAVYGNGLWDKIWGYIALDTDLSTVKGTVFDHKGETPGLGARITDAEIQVRYKGKKLAEGGGVTMIKGEGNDPAKIKETEVDGMSGATMTANGMNDMMNAYLGTHYKAYFSKNKGKI
jgi:Na+-transporting NADH:ubiquinone oxidoreductase subunit C